MFGMRILVTGSTGKVGRHVVAELLSQGGGGVTVRALARHPESAGLPPGADVVRGDLADPHSLAAAVAGGVDAVFLLWPFLTADAAPAALDAIGKPGRVVYLSSMGVGQPDPVNSSHAAMERLIQATGLPWTFLRAGGFAANTLGWAQEIRETGVVRYPYADAARSLIHERDIASVAARALTDPGTGHDGRSYVLTGPEVLTQAEQVRVIGEVVGRTLRFEEVPPAVMRDRMARQGWPAPLVDAMLDAWAAMRHAPEPVTSAVQGVTGTPARTFREWVAEHAEEFGTADML